MQYKLTKKLACLLQLDLEKCEENCQAFTPTCFQRCQDIAVRLKLLIYIF